jgi:hypothetical protein
MSLTLATHLAAEPCERSVVPPSLQPRAPLSYEIRDEYDRRVPPTLAGYKLRRGRPYRLVVRTQDKRSGGWKLLLLAPRSLLEVPGPDEVDETARMVTFHTASPVWGEHWQWFRSHVTALPVHIAFRDGRESYKFDIPLILLATRFRWIFWFVASAALTFLANAMFKERLSQPNLTNLMVFGGILSLLLLTSVGWDQWRFYRQARRLLAGRAGVRSGSRSPELWEEMAHLRDSGSVAPRAEVLDGPGQHSQGDQEGEQRHP